MSKTQLVGAALLAAVFFFKGGAVFPPGPGPSPVDPGLSEFMLPMYEKDQSNRGEILDKVIQMFTDGATDGQVETYLLEAGPAARVEAFKEHSEQLMDALTYNSELNTESDPDAADKARVEALKAFRDKVVGQ